MDEEESEVGSKKLTVTQLFKKPPEYNDQVTSGSDSETHKFRIIPF
jgi:hypothetical protein